MTWWLWLIAGVAGGLAATFALRRVLAWRSDRRFRRSEAYLEVKTGIQRGMEEIGAALLPTVTEMVKVFEDFGKAMTGRAERK